MSVETPTRTALPVEAGGTVQRPLALQILLAILWSFFGVRKRVDLQSDFARLPVVPVILAGVIAAALLVAGVLLVVRLVLAQVTA